MCILYYGNNDYFVRVDSVTASDTTLLRNIIKAMPGETPFSHIYLKNKG